jgi:hypothetical protein
VDADKYTSYFTIRAFYAKDAEARAIEMGRRERGSGCFRQETEVKPLSVITIPDLFVQDWNRSHSRKNSDETTTSKA